MKNSRSILTDHSGDTSSGMRMHRYIDLQCFDRTDTGHRGPRHQLRLSWIGDTA